MLHTRESTLGPSDEAKAPPSKNVALPERGRRKRLSRDERAADARAQIFAAAAKVVGEYGYGEASINRITEAAGMAQGTFYLYFQSRQVLFDELLPEVGEDMFRFIGKRLAGSKSVHEVEERGIRAFFDYLELNPGFFRILNEAEVAAPKAHARHFQQTADHFVASLERCIRTGEIKSFDREELETLVYVFMAARSYLYLRYVKGQETGARVPEKAIQAYLRLVRGGLR